MDWLEWLENSEDSSLISSCRLWTRREARCLYSWCIADSRSLISGTCKNTTHSVTPNSQLLTHLRVPCYFRFSEQVLSLWTKQAGLPNKSRQQVAVWVKKQHLLKLHGQCLVPQQRQLKPNVSANRACKAMSNFQCFSFRNKCVYLQA